MKTLTKLFLAVASGVFALSCVTDATSDLVVKHGDGPTTEITLSLEESRTQLGEEADGVYPLYWSEGDKISVNGVESAEAAISNSNPSSATFTVQGELTTPYQIAYPAAPAGKVIFVENQVHAGSSSFGKGVSTMYGCSNGDGVVLNHLTGVLKIGITGSGSLTMAQISTADRAPIAGAFEMDFEKGEVKATTASKSVINYNFPITADAEGLPLSSEPQYIHVAVPAGEYDELYVTLYDDQGGVMYATIKADENKPLSAGKVRAFSNAINYVPNDAVYVISDAASLKAFAEAAPSLEKDALLVADIDMSNEAWTPIEGYTKTINGNGYAIKGLTAPLFTTTSASIKGLHLVDVNISASEERTLGALVSTYTGTSIANCSVSGNITLTRDDSKSNYIGALVGNITTAANFEILNCVNNCAVTVTVSGASASYTTNVAGIVGKTADVADTVVATIKGNTNNGAISLLGTAKSPLRVGGVLGNCGYVDLNVEDCHNTAAISIGSAKSEFNTSEGTRIGGVIGSLYRATSGKTAYLFYAKDCSNSGAVVINASVTAKKPTHLGGCIGTLCDDRGASMTIDNVDNSGVVTFNGKAHKGGLYVGGVVGWGVSAIHMSNCDNLASGSVTVDVESKTDDQTMVGGLYGLNRTIHRGESSSKTTIKDCSNRATVTARLANSNQPLNCGGCFGRLFSFTTYVYDYTIENLDNYGSVVLDCTAQTEATHIGGVFGGFDDGFETAKTSTYCLLKNCDNIADAQGVNKIHVTNGSYGTLYAGGIVGYSMISFDAENCSNTMDYLFDANEATSTNCFGGLTAMIIATVANMESTVETFSNSGNITFDPKTRAFGFNIYSGFVTYLSANAVKNTVKANNITNSGNIYLNDKLEDVVATGAFCGYLRNNKTLIMSNSTNSGSISVNSCKGDNLFVGGFVGTSISDDTNIATMSFTNCYNTATADVSIVANCEKSTEYFIGGFAGYTRGEAAFKDCSNAGDVTWSGSVVAGGSIGGLLGRHTRGVLALNNVSNSGVVSAGTTDKALSIGTKLFVGGILGNFGTNNPSIELTAPIINTGRLNVENATIADVTGSHIGGIVGALNSGMEIKDARCYCDIVAAGCEGINIGFITATQRSDTNKATNSHIGGRIARELEEKFNTDGDPIGLAPKYNDIDEATYSEYIYGAPVTKEVATTDGCGYISAIDATPVI